MDILIDKTDQKKIRLLRAIFDSDHHTCTLEFLVKTLKLSNQTVLNIVDAIKNDMEDFHFKGVVSLEYSSANLLFQLSFSDSFNMQKLLYTYTRKSVKFRLLEALLNYSFKTLQQLADYLNIPYIQVRRTIKDINQFLKNTSLFVYSRKNVYLEGKEVEIRFFYTILLLAVYGAEEWPFQAFTFFDISNLLEECPPEVYNSKSLDKYFLVHYLSAVHLFRERRGYHVKKEDICISLYKPYSESNRLAFKGLEKIMKKYLPHFSERYITNSTQILCSSIIALGSYSSISDPPDFLQLDAGIIKKRTPHLTSHILDRVNHHLYIPLTFEERNKINYSLQCLHYRVFFIGNLSLLLSDVFTDYPIDDNDPRKQHKIRQIKKIVEIEMRSEIFELFRTFSEYLFNQYCIIFDKHLQLEKHTAPINISFLTNLSNQILKEKVVHHFSSYFNLNVANDISSEVDLIITNIPISSSVISRLRLHKPIVYCHQNLVDSDYTKISLKLSEIAREKFKIRFD